MNGKGISRRFFIGGAVSFGAFAGCRFLSVPSGSCSGGMPRLKFGVVSDLHIGYEYQKGDLHDCNMTAEMFVKALAWYRDQGVDAVMIPGDLADNGMVEELEAVASAWFSVFPDDRAPDGRKVERVFIYGNHDYGAYSYDNYALKRFPDVETCKRHVLRTDMKGSWQRIFHEPYSPVFTKKVKGYDFVGAHWDDLTGFDVKNRMWFFRGELPADYFAKYGWRHDPSMPFFYVQHAHLRNTCYGPWAWGHDDGVMTRALSEYPNAIAFSGHSHYSLTDERSIWQGAFTSVGSGSLCYAGTPDDSRWPCGYENTATESKDAAEIDSHKTMSSYPDLNDSRQGLLVSVYDDRIVLQRREFRTDCDLGDDWVMPLPTVESRPFAFAERARKSVPPAFPSDAELKVRIRKAKTRATSKHSPLEKDVVELSFPAALAESKGRPFEYEIVVRNDRGVRRVFPVVAEGFSLPREQWRAKAAMVCTLALDRLPEGECGFEVLPLDCWHHAGKPIVARLKTRQKELEKI